MQRQQFSTRQCKVGNSQAVIIPAKIAFSPKTELIIERIGEVITILPKSKNLGDALDTFKVWGRNHSGSRPEFESEKRNWHD